MNLGVPPVVLKAARKHTASLVFLHGLGDTGLGWAGALNTIKPHYLKVWLLTHSILSNLSDLSVKVICPTAPMLPVTLNGGMQMPAWYDIRSLEEDDKDREDMEGVDWAVNFVMDIVREEEEKHGIPAERMMVGGFSQGGAVSLRAALTSGRPLAGCIALSCYLPGDVSQYKDTATTPVFQAHGDQDQVVTYARGKLTSEVVSSLVKDHQFITYPDMGHEATMDEMEDIKKWIDLKLSL